MNSIRTVRPTLRTGRRALLRGAAGTAGAWMAGSALAQESGSPVTLIVGFPPGGSGDIFARLMSEHLRHELGSPVVVENRPGAGGLTAVAAFRRAPADGYTLMMHTGSTAVSGPISRKVAPYNAVEDFAWIALLSNAPFLIAVNPGLPITDLESLVEHAKSRQGKMSYGHAGLGTTVHLAAELLKERAGIAVIDVPYPGSGPALTDTIGGNVAFIVETYGTLIQQHRAGRIRIIGALTESRLPQMPEVGTAREIGLDVVAGTANLIAAPIGTPAQRQTAIARAVGRAMARPEMREQLAALGIQGFENSSPEQARAYVAREVARWTPVVKKLGIAL